MCPLTFSRLADAGIDAVGGPGQAVELLRPVAVSRLPGFAEGDVSVQDIAAQRAAPLLIEALGARCTRSRRLRRSRRQDRPSARAGSTSTCWPSTAIQPASCASIRRSPASACRRRRSPPTPATLPPGGTARPFDAILLDAPCSASGIVRRHPDVRWLRRATDIEALAAIQARLLDALWPLLAPGGRLLYCTCSVFRAEGGEQIDAFLQRQSDAVIARSPPSPGHLLPLPDNPQTSPAPASGLVGDGFFLTLLEKKRDPTTP